MEVDLTRKKPSSSWALVGLSANQDKSVALEVEPPKESTSNQINLKDFLDEVAKALSKSAFDQSNPADSSRQKFQMSFNRVASVSHNVLILYCRSYM